MNLFASFVASRRRARALETLRSLDDRILRDIGIERSDLGHVGRSSYARLQDLGR